MKFIADYAALRAALSLCASIVEKKTQIGLAILKDVRVVAAGEVITLATSDLDVTAICTIPAVVAGEGGCTIEAAALLDIAKSARESVRVVLNRENMHVEIATGSARYALPAMSIDDYPTLPEMEDSKELKFSASELLPMLRTSAYAMSSENMHGLTLRGVHIKATKGAVEVCALNGFQLALTTLKKRSSVECAILLPAKLVRVADKLSVSGDATDVVVRWNHNHISLALGPVSLFGRIAPVQFPDYSTYIRKPSKFTAQVETVALLEAARRVAPFSAEHTNCVFVTVATDKIRVASTSRALRGKCADSVTLHTPAPESTRVGMSAAHLVDALAAIGTASTDIDFGAEKQAILLRPVDSDLPFSALHLVMPIDIEKYADADAGSEEPQTAVEKGQTNE